MKNNILLDLLYPKNITCICCGEDYFVSDEKCICPICLTKIHKIEGKICLRCGQEINTIDKYCDLCKQPKPYDVARACFVYEDKIVAIIRNLKFHNRKYLAKNIAYWLFELYKKENFDCDIIVPVPMTNERLKKRGYNHSTLIAKHLGELLNIPVDEQNLCKIKETKTQVGLGYKLRRKNLQGSFKTKDRTFFKDKKVLIIDDVFTTGATIECCATALKKGKAKSVFALTFAHTSYHFDEK